MQEFTEALQILKDLGVIQIFAIPIASLVFLYLFKKFLLNGSGQHITNAGVFLKDIIQDYMQNEKDRIKSQASIEFRLGELCEKFNSVVEGLFDNRRHIEEKISYFETTLEGHVIETHNLLLILKKRSEPIQDTLDHLVDTQYFKTQEKTP